MSNLIQLNPLKTVETPPRPVNIGLIGYGAARSYSDKYKLPRNVAYWHTVTGNNLIKRLPGNTIRINAGTGSDDNYFGLGANPINGAAEITGQGWGRSPNSPKPLPNNSKKYNRDRYESQNWHLEGLDVASQYADRIAYVANRWQPLSDLIAVIQAATDAGLDIIIEAGNESYLKGKNAPSEVRYDTTWPNFASWQKWHDQIRNEIQATFPDVPIGAPVPRYNDPTRRSRQWRTDLLKALAEGWQTDALIPHVYSHLPDHIFEAPPLFVTPQIKNIAAKYSAGQINTGNPAPDPPPPLNYAAAATWITDRDELSFIKNTTDLYGTGRRLWLTEYALHPENKQFRGINEATQFSALWLVSRLLAYYRINYDHPGRLDFTSYQLLAGADHRLISPNAERDGWKVSPEYHAFTIFKRVDNWDFTHFGETAAPGVDMGVFYGPTRAVTIYVNRTGHAVRLSNPPKATSLISYSVTTPVPVGHTQYLRYTLGGYPTRRNEPTANVLPPYSFGYLVHPGIKRRPRIKVGE